MALSILEYQLVRDLVQSRSGIVLDAGKEYLIEARLGALAQVEGANSVSELLARIRQPDGKAIERDVIDAMTTNETSFFRDMSPFEAMKNFVVPELLKHRVATQTLNIWCAASSTGQEPYSLAIMIRETFPQLSRWKINFVASDLSRDVLDRARVGQYSQHEVDRGMPVPLLNKYFKKVNTNWQINPDIRAMITFREFNLVEPWPQLQKFDVIFIRNVLIYFNDATRRTILGKMRGVLQPDGYLFLGGAETTLNLDDNYEIAPVKRSGCYCLKRKISMAA